MPGSVPAIPLARAQRRSSRLVDRHPSFDAATCQQYPWGQNQILSASGGHRVERITVGAGKTMPAHLHEHRCEHWTVLDGEGEVTLDGDALVISSGDSLYVPAGSVHGLKAGPEGDVVFVAVLFGDTVCDADDRIDAVVTGG